MTLISFGYWKPNVFDIFASFNFTIIFALLNVVRENEWYILIKRF